MTEKNQGTFFLEFFAGCMSGIGKVFVGQPFDIVKVRLQSAPERMQPSITNIISTIYCNEGGLLAFWKGSLPPIMSVGASVSIQFGVNENVKKLFQAYNNGKKMSFAQLYACGALAGFFNSFVTTPAEHIRIKMQTQPKVNPLYAGSIDCMKKVYSLYGLKGLYRGAVPNILREGIGYGAFFSSYAKLMDHFMKPGQTKKDVSLSIIGFSGVIAGILLWATVFPIDVIKTRMQTDNLANPQHKGILDSMRQIYAQRGIRGFFKVFASCMARAVPVNGGVFMIYETGFRMFTKPQEMKAEFAYR